MTELTRVLIGSSVTSPDGDGETADGMATVTIASANQLREAAEAATTSLLWIVDGAAKPLADALPSLLGAGTTPAASLPVDDAGVAVETLIGRFADDDDDALVAAAGRRQIPIRHTHLLSLLVDREPVLRLDPPDPGRFGPYAGSEWTARLFALGGGVLVPASRVQASGAARASALSAMRVMRSGAWRRGETLRELTRALGLPTGLGRE